MDNTNDDAIPDAVKDQCSLIVQAVHDNNLAVIAAKSVRDGETKTCFVLASVEDVGNGEHHIQPIAPLDGVDPMEYLVTPEGATVINTESVH